MIQVCRGALKIDWYICLPVHHGGLGLEYIQFRYTYTLTIKKSDILCISSVLELTLALVGLAGQPK